MINKQPMSLYEAHKQGSFQVASVPHMPLLKNLGLRPGTHITVQHRYSLGGPVVLRVEGAYDLALGKDIARKVTVVEAIPA